ncbi:MAG TPA: DUF3341 domain-containing protein [Pyrinomonadaceae bacterium]|jgi:hypothetical protein|nr:DUF3341 domain-containing protein [Pyrinomonadaceae bacterium]
MDKKLYGLMAEFDSATELVDAARAVRDAGYLKTDGFSPFPIHEMDEALGIKRSILPVLVFFGGITGLLLAVSLQVFIHYIDYPLNIGGRPYLSWISFVPPSFELTILLAGFTAVFGMLFLNGLPRPYHPVFNVPRFALATREKFFLLIEAADDKYDYDETRAFLQGLQPQEVFDVEE